MGGHQLVPTPSTPYDADRADGDARRQQRRVSLEQGLFCLPSPQAQPSGRPNEAGGDYPIRSPPQGCEERLKQATNGDPAEGKRRVTTRPTC